MKKIILSITLIMLLFSCSMVPAGYVGVKVYLLGSEKGVDTEELGVGRYYVGVNQELYLFPTFQQNYVWTKDPAEGSPDDESITFQTQEGLNCNADVGISYHLDATKVSVIFQKYRRGIDEITDVFMRNHVRDAFNSIASEYPVESVYGKGKSELIERVEEKIKSDLEEQGIIIDKLYWVGSIRLPENVVNSLNAKIEATQRAMQSENELRQAEAEAKKKVAVAKGEAEAKIAIAEGEAKSNYIKSNSITNGLLEYEKVINQREAIKKWDGQLPKFTSETVPLIEYKE